MNIEEIKDLLMGIERKVYGVMPFWIYIYFSIIFVLSVLIVIIVKNIFYKFIFEMVFLLVTGYGYIRLSMLAEDIALLKQLTTSCKLLDAVKDNINNILNDDMFKKTIFLRNLNMVKLK
jgi:hypothetical protein